MTTRLILLASACALTLIGCTTPAPRYSIDSTSYQATGKNERIQFIVLHYTAENDAESLRILTEARVSAHYLILKKPDARIYQLVPDSERAWHAGAGSFAGRSVLNDTSIGIEIVNDGIAPEYRGQKGYHPYAHFVPFDALQIKKVAQLVNDLAARYRIDPTHIIAHSDMAPSRKIDPGAKFPWQHLYQEYGIGAWYDEADKAEFLNRRTLVAPSVQEIKQAFRDYGYPMNDTDTWDKASRDVVYAFQLHFRPEQPTGEMDAETYAILQALNRKYGKL